MAASAAALSNPSAHTAKPDSNRLNALLSTGPRTAEGKAASSQNATRHGLFTSISVLPPHERVILDEFLAELGPQPGDSPEMADVLTRWAILRYRLDKCQRLEFGCHFQLALRFCQANDLEFPSDPIEIARIEALAHIDDEQGAKVVTRLHNYEARLRRDLNRTIKEYNELAAQEAEEPEPDPQDLASFSQPESAQPEIPRSAPCPCGSGLKYKRCCGKNAPPQLNL